MLIWTGTAAVESGSATVVVDSGAALTAEVVTYGAMVVLDGVVYFAGSLTDTSTLELTRVYAGSNGTVDMEIWPVSQDTTNLVNLAQVVARTQAQINILDKNSQGLFFYMKGVTGAADPGSGFIAFDDADPTLVTEAYIDVLDANGRAVGELLDLWEAGTTIVVRSLTTTAYRAYTVATNTDESGWSNLALTYIGHDGVLADNEALAISWSIAAAGLEIGATGSFADRDDYDDEPAGFVFLSADGDGDEITVSSLFRKNSATTADWGPAVPFQGPQGARGWSPVFSVVNDGTRRVLRLVDYVGGEDPKPTTGINQYVSAGGLTGTIGSATDIRGPQGLSAYEVAVVAGFAGTEEEWLATLIGASAYQVAVAEGFVGDEEAWLASLNGADGTDPGALFNWDDGTADEDPGAGNIRADNADLSAAAFLYVSKEGRTGDDLETFLLSIGGSTNAVKGHVTLTSSGGNSQAIILVESLTDATDYVKIGLIASSHSGATGFVDGTAVSLQFNRAGNQGSADAISVASAINASPEVEEPAATTKIAITDPDNGDILGYITLETLSGAVVPPSGIVDPKTANYTIVAGDRNKVISVSAAAAARTISIDPTGMANGDRFTIKKNDGTNNAVTVDPNGAVTIDGSLSHTLRGGNQSVTLAFDGTNFQVISQSALPAPRGHIFGLILSNNASDTTNDIDISAGAAASDEANPALMSLTASLTKRLDAAWAVGSGNGGLDTGSIANTSYHLWLIQRSDTGVVDVLFSASATAPTMPANYDRKRRIGSVIRSGGTILGFVQDGDDFTLNAPVTGFTDTNPGTSALTRALAGIPVGIRVKARGTLYLNTNSTSFVATVKISDLAVADTAPSASANHTAIIQTLATSGNYRISTAFAEFTNTAAQVRVRASASDANFVVTGAVYGWSDPRGRV